MIKIDKTMLLLLVVVAGFLLVLAALKCNSCTSSAEGQAPDSVSYWRNKYGDMVASLKMKEAAFGKAEKTWKDSIAKAYNAKPKFIKEIVTATVQGQADITPVGNTESDFMILPDQVDCPPQIKNLRKTFGNGYYRANVQIGDSSYMHLSSFDTLTVVWKKVKEGNLFNRKKYLQIDISSANPYNRIEGVKAYRVPDKKQKKIGLGMQLGYGYDGNKFRPYLGAGISYNIIRL